jgi:chromate reductase
MAGYKVGYFVSGLATKSLNRLPAHALVRVAPTELQMAEISFKDLRQERVPHENRRGSRDVAREDSTAIAQQHLRSIPAFCNSPLMNSIEAYIHFEDGLVSEDGHDSIDATREFPYSSTCRGSRGGVAGPTERPPRDGLDDRCAESK